MIKKKVIILYLSVICFLASNAQVIYTKQDSITNNFYGITEAIGGTDLIITNVKSFVKSNGDFTFLTQLLITTSAGQLIDSVLVDSNFYTYGQIKAHGNNYYLYGLKYLGTNLNNVITMPTLIKLDLNFNVSAINYLNHFNGNIISAVQSMTIKNNRIFLGFGGTNNKSSFFKLDLQLTKIDSVKINGDGLLNLINYGKNILICGYGFNNPSSMGRLQVHELDTAFNLVSYYNMDSLTYVTAGPSVLLGCSQKIGIDPMRGNLIEISDSKYLVSGYSDVVYQANCASDGQNVNSIIKNNNQVLKTNILGKQNGIHEQSPYFGKTDKKYNYLYIVSKSASNLTPFSPQNIETEIMVTKLDTNGTIIWNNFYNTPNYYYDGIGISGTSDSGVVVCGVRYNISSPSINGVCEGFVMKINKNGSLITAGIEEQNIKNNNLFKCYPNPTKEGVYFDVFLNTNYQLEIFDMLGKSVYLDNNYQNKSAIQIDFLNAGQYIYKLKTKESFFTGKLIKE